MPKIDEQKIKLLLERGVHEIHPNKESLEKKLLSGKKLRIKFGIDPTAPDLHLGHTVPLRKLRQFQDAGHTAVLIIGDFTARIGDPTGKSEERKPLTTEQVRINMKKYLRQAAKVLDIELNWIGKPKKTSKFEIYYNGEWFFKEGLEKIMELARLGTLNQMLQRAEFKKRIKEGGSVSMVESLYPIMQGYDSVKVMADVEMGGSDQKFNLLMGRQVQKHFGMPEQDIMTLPLIEGTDGVKKMSKSYGNYIGLNETPKDMFGKIMSIPDSLILKYVELLTDLDIAEIKKIKNPRDRKAILSKEIVRMYNGEKEAQEAEEEFNRTFRDKTPTFISFEINKEEEFYPKLVNQLLTFSGVSSSATIGKRLIIDGAVEIDGKVDRDWNKFIKITQGGNNFKIGKKTFIKVKLKK